MSNTERQPAANAGKTTPTAKATLEATAGLPPSNPFANLNDLRLGPNFQDDIAVQRVLTTVPVGKPGRQDFVRVHPGEGYHLQTMALELKEDHEVYLVSPSMWGELAGEIWPVILYLVANRAGIARIWPIKLPGPDGKDNPWHQSAREAAALAMRRWTRISANMSLGAYEVHVATGELSEPKWPTETFSEILKVAFKDRYIDGPDHLVVKRLRGEA